MMRYELYDIKPISEILKPGLNFIKLPQIPIGMRRYVLYIRFKNKSNMRNIIKVHTMVGDREVEKLLIESLEPFETNDIPKDPQLKHAINQGNPFCLFSYGYEKTLVIKATAACNIFMNFIDW